MNKQKIEKIIKKDKLYLKENFHVDSIGLFGSYLKGEQNTNSDIDILVEFSQPVSMFEFIRLERYLERKLGKNVDLVTKKSLKPSIGKVILEEVQII